MPGMNPFQPNPLSPIPIGGQIMNQQHPLYEHPTHIDHTITARDTMGNPVRNKTYLRDNLGRPILPGEFGYEKVRAISVNGQFDTSPISDLGRIIDSTPVSRPLSCNSYDPIKHMAKEHEKTMNIIDRLSREREDKERRDTMNILKGSGGNSSILMDRDLRDFRDRYGLP